MKQVSIGRHMLKLLTVAFAVMALVMFIFVHILANAAAEYDIRLTLEREVNKNLRGISADEDGQIVYNEDFVQRNEEIYFIVLDEEGKTLCGEYPQGCPFDMEPKPKRMRQIQADGETFYIRDMHHYIGYGRHVYLRAVVRKSDIYSRYQTMEYLAYASILAVSFLAILGGILLSKRISASLKEMCQSAESIGQNMSERMEYNGRFYELSVLTKANNRMLDRLEETFRQQEQFTSDVAHELRTPVAVIRAQCQYVYRKPVSREEYGEAFEVIDRQSLKVSTIISTLLELSRLDSSRREIQKEDVDLSEIVQSVCEDLQQKSGDSLQFYLKLAEAHTVGDISLAMIAIENLVTNALKYSKAGSPVEIETGIQDGMVFVSVKDHGAGISREEMQHIFKRFYKADKSRNTEGFGLGLPLTMKIAQKHGGTVLAESEPGKGSKFTLLLACSPNDPEPEKSRDA